MALINTGRHLDEDDIEKYSLGRTSAAESARFDEHLLVCEACQDKVAKSDEYVAAMQMASLSLRREARQPVPNRRTFQRLIPVFAVFGLVVVMAAVGIRLAGRPAVVTAFSVNLEATRGAEVGANAPAGRALNLHLELTGLPVTASYRVEMVDGLGKVVWQGTVPAQDSKATALVPAMSSGSYFVQVYASSGELLREFGLNVGA